MRILFDKNVPVGVRGFLRKHEVRTVVEMRWPDQLDNGELLRMAEGAGFDVIITSDQNIRYQQSWVAENSLWLSSAPISGQSYGSTGRK